MDCSKVSNVLLSSCDIVRICRPKPAFDSLQPAWESSARGFCIDIGTWSSQEVDTSRADSLEEWLECEHPFGSIIARLSFDQCPVYIERYAIEAKSFHFLEDV